MVLGAIKGLFMGKKRNCLIRIYRQYNGNDCEELVTYGYMAEDQKTGVIRLKSEFFNLDEPVVPYRYFKKLNDPKYRGISRVVSFFTAQPGYFAPVDHSFVEMLDKPLVGEKKEKSCVKCKYDNLKPEERRGKSLEVWLKEQDYDVYPMCNKHMSQFIKAKFRTVPEERKEWYNGRLDDRASRRSKEEKKFWESPSFMLLVFCAMLIFLVIINYQFGLKGIEKIIDATFRLGLQKMAAQMATGGVLP